MKRRRRLGILSAALAWISVGGAEPTLIMEETFESALSSFGQSLVNHRHVELQDMGGRSATKGIRVRYKGFERGTERVIVHQNLPEVLEEATILYDLYFEEAFQFTKGGKLPGLGPKNHVTGGGALHDKGWSARTMWTSQDGYLESIRTYIYHQNQPGSHGDKRYAEGFRFERNRWYRIGLHIKLNSAPELADGVANLSIDGEVLVRHSNIRFHNSLSNEATIVKVMFETFHGGGNDNWTPRDEHGNYTDVYARYDNFQVWRGDATNAGNDQPKADAGLDQLVVDTDHDQAETVTLDGSGSRAFGESEIVQYDWWWADGHATGAQPEIFLPLGRHDVTLRVTDRDGASAEDRVQIQINATHLGLEALSPTQVSASHAQEGREALYATDGDPETRWSSDARPAVLTMGFASPVHVQRGRIHWYKGDERQQSFQVEGRQQGDTAWYTLFHGRSSGQTSGFEVIPLRNLSRVVELRIVGDGNTVNDWTSPFEVEWHGEAHADMVYDAAFIDASFSGDPRGVEGLHTHIGYKGAGNVPNGVRYAHGITSSDAAEIQGKLPAFKRSMDDHGNGSLLLSYRRWKNGTGDPVEGYEAGGMRYTVEKIHSLMDPEWESDSGQFEQVGDPQDQGDGMEEVYLRIKEPESVQDTLFLRVNIEPVSADP